MTDSTDTIIDHTPQGLIDNFQVSEALAFLMDIDVVTDYASDYGEPGYELEKENGFFVIGDWWCKDRNCDFHETYDNGDKKLHYVDIHYKKLFMKLAEAGMETDFYDEWMVDSNSDKAYRTQPNSYTWQSSIMFSEELGEYLTPDDDIQMWIDEVVNNHRKCITSSVWSEADLIAAGFQEYQCGYANGWHPGQTDDPKQITDMILAEKGDVDIVFYISYVGQFDVHFCAFYKNREDW